MKTSKHSSYSQSQSQSHGMGRPTKVDHQDTEQPRDEAEEIKRRIYVGGVPASMTDQDLYHFFEAIGPVEYAIVLNRKYDNFKTSRYGFVTFVSLESAKSALAAASTAKLTLGAPWQGWSLTVGPAVQRKYGHHYNHHHQQKQEEGTRVWSRSSEQVTGETKPIRVMKAGPTSKLRVDAESWKGRSGQQPGEMEAQLFHHQQAINLYFQQQQQLQYQAELHYNMMAQQSFYHLQQYPDTTTTTSTTDQLMIMPTTYYHYPSGSVVWPQYQFPLWGQYGPTWSRYDQAQAQAQAEQMSDSGYHDFTNLTIASISMGAGDTSQSGTYEGKEKSDSPVMNLSQVLQQENHDNQEGGDIKRVGPYKRLKTFTGETLLRTKEVWKDGSQGERGDREASKPVKDREPGTTFVINKGKEKNKGIKKKVIHALPKAEILPEPFKQLSIK